jgi:hypothetical protein
MDWRPRTAEEIERIFDDVNLTGPFWNVQAT